MEMYIYKCENCLSKDICDELINILQKKEGNELTLFKTPYTYSESVTRQNLIVDNINRLLTKHIDIYSKNIQIIDNIIYYPVIPEHIFKTNFQVKCITNQNNVNTRFLYDKFYIEDNYFTNKLTFIIYLNDNFDGGETVFINGVTIIPKIGSLLIFPTEWTYAYKENNLLNETDIKYIIKGCLYQSDRFTT